MQLVGFMVSKGVAGTRSTRNPLIQGDVTERFEGRYARHLALSCVCSFKICENVAQDCFNKLPSVINCGEKNKRPPLIKQHIGLFDPG